MLDKDELPSFIARLAGDLHVGLLKLLSLDAPLIVAVNGAAAGAGMSLVLAADLAYAGPRTRLVPAYPTIGFSADGGMSWTLPRIVGEKRAAEIMLLGETFTAAQAAAEHLVTAALDEDGEAFDAAVLDKARAVAAGPRRAFGAIRRLLRASAGASLSDQLANEAAAMADLATGADVAAGIAALAAKTRPVFTE
jgi:2-(1,2-epoxy-1,2-dihydrophenyl)acetyl-CoA isomerase